MTNEPKNTRLSYVPAILAGTTALVAAISTLYVNLRDKPEPAPVATEQVVSATESAAPARPPTVVAPAAPRVLLLRLERVQVDNDGSVGSTDWTFQVKANDQPLFAVPMPELNDKPGQNLARPADPEQAAAEVEVPAGKASRSRSAAGRSGCCPAPRRK